MCGLQILVLYFHFVIELQTLEIRSFVKEDKEINVFFQMNQFI